jgi:RNA polymerase sigma factor (sigma-70 family)
MEAATDSIPTRKSLLKRLKSVENSESWQEFFDTYWSLIYSMAIRSGLGDAEAQDVVQETIISVARSMPNFRYDPKIGSFKAWLRKLTRWRIIDHIRHRNAGAGPFIALQPDWQVLSEIPDETDVSFEASWDDEWRKAIIDAAAEKTKARVDAKQYQIFDLYSLRGWSTKKVATTLRISQARVHVSSHRVRKIFEQELKAIDLEPKL